ncbi:MAG: hypothetical protein COV67_12385 [Nitrospinae bacterium CG11_big_fil_rev_8_21_14_0_20_56_8]|nr:MAG: hypothetical protein COV67_12385 [Nitrospinae bacterium CG11_big_fil_rev_8_21_14_0_20_56_8]
MSGDDRWDDAFEDGGTTLGPEEALKREIEKVKALKVERLQLRDQIEKLQQQNARLAARHRELEEQHTLHSDPSTRHFLPPPLKPRVVFPAQWGIFLLLFNLGALALLIYLISNN